MSWYENPRPAVAPATTTTLTAAIPADPLEFARQFLHFHPDELQARMFDPAIKRGLLCCTRQFGKSTCVAALTLHKALTKPGSTSLVLAPLHTQSGQFLSKIIPHLRRLGIRPKNAAFHPHSLALPNGSRILTLTDTDTSVRSYDADLIVVDEAARVNDAAIRGVRAALSTTGGSMWMISTPNGRQGFFYQAWTNQSLDAFRLRVTADQCRRIDRNFLAEERLLLGDLLYSQEYECNFLGARNAVFDDDLLKQAIFEEVRRPDILFTSRRYFAGIDLGKLIDPSAIVIIEVNDITCTGLNYITWDPLRSREYTVRLIERIPLHTPYPDVVSRIKEITEMQPYRDQITLVLDATGVGEPIADLMKARGINVPTIKFTLTQESKPALIDNLRMMFDLRELRIPNTLPNTDHLLRELSAMRAVPQPSGHICYQAAPGEHDDLAIALALAAHPGRPRTGTVGEKSNRLLYS